MVPFILSQKSANALGPLTDEELLALKVHYDRSVDFFRVRDIPVPDVVASATWSQTPVTKSTGTPPQGPFIDSDENTYNQPDEQWDPEA